MTTLVPYRLSAGLTAASRAAAHASVAANVGVLGDGDGDGDGEADRAGAVAAGAACLPASPEQPAVRRVRTAATAAAEGFGTVEVCHGRGAPWALLASAAPPGPGRRCGHQTGQHRPLVITPEDATTMRGGIVAV